MHELSLTNPHWHLMLFAGLLFLLSHIGGWLANLAHAPRLIGYLLMGIVLGPSVLGLFSDEMIYDDFTIITDIALAIIAFLIGSSLRLKTIYTLKRPILTITFIQVVMTILLVTGVLMLTLPFLVSDSMVEGLSNPYFVVAVLVGAAAASTAPAAIMMLTREYDADQHFRTLLLGTVALSDALTLIFFALATSIAQNVAGGEAFALISLLEPLSSIALALMLGGAVAGMTCLLFPHMAKRLMLGMLFGSVLVTGGLALSLGFSALLANMMFGFVIINFADDDVTDKTNALIDAIEEPIFGVFFLLASAHLDLSVVKTAAELAMVIVVARYLAKYGGTWAGAQLSGAPDEIRKYMGLALLPAAGVMIGLTLEMRSILPVEYGPLLDVVVSGVIGSILVNELSTPFMLRHAIHKVKEESA